MGANEAVVCKVDNLKNGEMKAFNVNNVDILLSKIDDKFYAVAAFCTHYGAPLEEGVLSGGRIVCPWHHACFHSKSGDLLEPPARDALPSYEVRIENDDVIVKLPEKVESNRLPEMARHDSRKESRTYVILGAGAAGNAAAQALREDGFQGRIVMITYETRGPYDRPNLSKDYLQGEADPEWMPLRGEEFYSDNDIELLLSKKVNQINTKDKYITFSNGDTLNYDKLLIASGGIPRRLNLTGSELNNVFTLRNFDDTDAIIKASESASNAVIIGASFIGMETADSLLHRKLGITVVAPERTPLEHIFGNEIGKLFQQLHEENGIKFKLGHTIYKIEGDGNLEAVILDNGERIETDLVIIGIGVNPATNFIDSIDLESDGSIKVDQYFHVGNDIYAAGDIATFPYWYSGSDIRIEHWRSAEQLGRITAHNMAGKKITYESIPFFWTVQAGITLRYVGYVKDWDEIMVNGNISDKNFIAFYIKNNQVQAAAGCNRNREMAAIEELMRLKKMPAPENLKSDSIDLISLLKE
jgi:NADPH-dependent 2,4-dienoyl-CoA reductase/sulfur reductase-like enzyme/nitrite reductase/ring-hydroxylating ferredoxin subunit